MILLNKIVKEFTESAQLHESKHPHSSLLRLVNQNIVDAETKVIFALKEISNIINKPALSKSDKKKIEKLLSEYKDYFDRSKGGTSTVKRGFKMQAELEKLIK